VANTLKLSRNGAVGFIVGHYSPSIILRIAIIARTSAAVGVIAKLIMFGTFHLPANWRNR
jgi:hypothetical protein